MPRLTEQEQQEIVRYIEADRPLPEKYRFLLFEEKHEVELVWNGKSSEVSNIVLPFQVIEQVDEPRVEKPHKDEPLIDANTRELKKDIGVHWRLIAEEVTNGEGNYEDSRRTCVAFRADSAHERGGMEGTVKNKMKENDRNDKKTTGRRS